MLVNAHGEEADNVLVDGGLTLQLGNDARGGLDVEHHKVSFAVALDFVRQTLQAP